ncbi:hypothetical protein KL86DPRO_11861 [uncultured delta proteobacterium]|uniref:Uncharacterized protein n=1 Tax=uncultured delta proteobacterium TaxID=34034 RepID=A0A212JNJ4_9DELT|nr:hypothetical protein KL86DPRO_11861 [uncultured delta proteobacterium]
MRKNKNVEYSITPWILMVTPKVFKPPFLLFQATLRRSYTVCAAHIPGPRPFSVSFMIVLFRCPEAGACSYHRQKQYLQ